MKTKILTIRFENEIYFEEIPLFRGAIISSMDRAKILFHNHEGEKFRFAYPLIQYKRINKKAAIICIGEGTEAIGEFFSSANFDVQIGSRFQHLVIDRIDANQCLVQCWNDYFSYNLRTWLPFNKENYQEYLRKESVSERSIFLEKLLIGNILSFAKGIGIHFEREIHCKITQLSEPMGIIHKGIKLMGFDVEFKTNVSLPNYIGLGKGVSMGKGTVVKKIENK